MRSRKLDQLQRALADQRGRRVVFVSHCLLSVDEVVDGFQAAGVGMCQMPCPEQRAWGGVAKRYLVPAYGSQGTLWYRLRRLLTCVFLWRTRWVYARLARRVVREAADYARSGFEVAGVVGVGAGRFNAALLASAGIEGEGYFIRALRRRLARRRLDIPFAEHDLAAELQGGPVPPVEFRPADPPEAVRHVAGVPERGHAQ